MVLEDGLNGVFDLEKEHSFIEMTKSDVIEYRTDPTMVYYTNFMMTEEHTKYYRISYTYMEAFGDIGGVIEITILFFSFLLIPIYYNISGIVMLKDYVLEGEH